MRDGIKADARLATPSISGKRVTSRRRHRPTASGARCLPLLRCIIATRIKDHGSLAA
jgi:hypothetical protein